MKHYTRAEYIKTYPCHHVSSINPCWWPHASTVSIVPSRCSNNRNDFIFEDLKDSEFDHISKKKNTSKNLEKRYPFWKDSPKLTPTSLRIMSMWHHCNLLRYICIIFTWMIQFPLTVVVSMHWMVSDHQFIAWHHCSIGLRGATVVSFLQSAVICGMFSSWNQIMPSFTCTSEPPPPNFSALANQKKHHPHKKNNKLQCRWPATLPGFVSPAAKKSIKVAVAPSEGGSNDPPQMRTTPVFPKVPLVEAKGSQGKQSQDFWNGWKGAQFLSIPIWLVFGKNTALSLESLHGSISEWGSELQMVKDKPYKDLVEFPVNLDVCNYISMALWPSCTTVDVRNAGNSSWWVVGPLS